ncbi:hypothetical protein [Siccirubricoccus sp. G192]|uniref:hypothetical protein n=1 Tax=Siccirubricoccus sp. G192 TaxID=2849651 RepID=UPI002811EE2E|nr:hypothetical protein [Siccirubricoccus sp. G192]
MPISLTPPARISWPMQCTRSKPKSCAATSSTTSPKPCSVKQEAPARSARVTTPSGRET